MRNDTTHRAIPPKKGTPSLTSIVMVRESEEQLPLKVPLLYGLNPRGQRGRGGATGSQQVVSQSCPTSPWSFHLNLEFSPTEDIPRRFREETTHSKQDHYSTCSEYHPTPEPENGQEMSSIFFPFFREAGAGGLCSWYCACLQIHPEGIQAVLGVK